MNLINFKRATVTTGVDFGRRALLGQSFASVLCALSGVAVNLTVCLFLFHQERGAWAGAVPGVGLATKQQLPISHSSLPSGRGLFLVSVASLRRRRKCSNCET